MADFHNYIDDHAQVCEARVRLGAYNDSDLGHVMVNWFTIKQAANYLGVSQTTIRKYIKQQKLKIHPWWRHAGTYRIDPVSVLDMKESPPFDPPQSYMEKLL